MSEAVARYTLGTVSLNRMGTNKAMPAVQFSAELLHQLPLITTQHSGDNFNGKLFTLHACNSQCILMQLCQAFDPFPNYCLNPGW
jgi:hypothetical protein